VLAIVKAVIFFDEEGITAIPEQLCLFESDAMLLEVASTLPSVVLEFRHCLRPYNSDL
jgi:hypothetical protein